MDGTRQDHSRDKMYRKAYKPSSVERYSFKDTFTASPDAYKQRVDPRYVDKEGKTNLHLAILQDVDNEVLVEYAIKAGCNVNASDVMGRRPIHLAADRGYMKSLQKLITYAAELNILDKEGLSPLMTCSRKGFADLSRVLIKAGAHVNFSNDKNETALHYAVGAAKVDTIKSLLDYKCKTNLQNESGDTALIMACRLSSLETIKLLLQAKANPNLMDSCDYSALHWVATMGLPECAWALINAGADIDLVGEQPGSPSALVTSIKANNSAVLRVLLEAKCDTSSIDGLNGTALGMASILGFTSCAEALLDHGEDPDETGFFGMTPLMSAAFEGRVDVTNLLLERGADPNATSRTGVTALIKALLLVSPRIEKERHKIVASLIRANADPQKRIVSSNFFTAATNGQNDPLSVAISSGYISLVQMLLLAGSKVNTKELREWFASTDTFKTFSSSEIKMPVCVSRCKGPVLKHMCRLTIRRALGKRVLDGIDTLPIAPSVKRYLQFEEFDHIEPHRAKTTNAGTYPFYDLVTVTPCGIQALEKLSLTVQTLGARSVGPMDAGRM